MMSEPDSTVYLDRLMILDWFDGPIEALGYSERHGSSYHLCHVGVPPIGPRSVYQVRRLQPHAYPVVREVVETCFGPWSSPVRTIHPSSDPSISDRVDGTVANHVTPVDRRVGYAQTATLIGHALDIVWLDERSACGMGDLAGDALWHAVASIGHADDST